MYKEEATPKYQAEHPKKVDGRTQPKAVALRKAQGLAGMSPAKRKEIQKKATAAAAEAAKKRRALSTLIEEALTLDRRRSIAESLVATCCNGTVKIGDRLRILDLILRITGELPGGTTKTEIEALGDVILKID